MDSVTQFALGAAIGEATLRRSTPGQGKTFAWGAALLGGLVATIPDLDVFTRPFLTAPRALASHRGLSHSIFACTLLSPLLAWTLRRILGDRGMSLRHWTGFVWLALNTHWMLDSLTTYGTQIFQPFSDYPVNIGSIFIIDPLYTLPLIVGTLASLWVNRAGRPLHLRAVLSGLALSTLYLLFTLFSKFVVHQRLQQSWREKGLAYRQMITVPTPFNCLLYNAYVDTGSDVWVSNGSLFDRPDRPVEWYRINKNQDLFPAFGTGPAGRTLLWFSRGFYRLEMREGKPVFVDLRFGRLRGWFEEPTPEGGDYIFSFYLLPPAKQGPYDSFDSKRPAGRFAEFPWRRMWRRIWGGEY